MSTPDLDRTRTLLSDMGFEFAPTLLAELAERAVKEKRKRLGNPTFPQPPKSPMIRIGGKNHARSRRAAVSSAAR